MKINFSEIILAILLFCSLDLYACTVSVIDGEVTDDGRPIYMKVRHPAEPNVLNRIWIHTNTTYRYIAVNNAMGLNENGLATGHTASSYYTPSGASTNDLRSNWYYDPNETMTGPKLTINILSGCSVLDDVRDLIELIFDNGTSNIFSSTPILDAQGNTALFEINENYWWLEYPTLNPNRIPQDTYGFIVREMYWHYNEDGTDDMYVTGTRWETGTKNIQGMISECNSINVNLMARGTGDPNTGYEYMRYGPGRPMAPIADPRNRACVMVHGVLPGEDPNLATMWVGLGQANYTIMVPTWVWIRFVPDSLGAGDNGHMFDRSLSLFNKGNELITQQSTFPMEKHIFSEVLNDLLPHWRAFDTPSRDTVQRVADKCAEDAYSLLDCLDTIQADNKAPNIDFTCIPNDLTVLFNLDANDPDGSISQIEWDFGDDQNSLQQNPVHTFSQPGTYLISCTVTDDDGVSITDWDYYTVPVDFDLANDDDFVDEYDLDLFFSHWLCSDCKEPDWCGGADFDHSESIDITDFAILSENWLQTTPPD